MFENGMSSPRYWSFPFICAALKRKIVQDPSPRVEGARLLHSLNTGSERTCF